MPEPTPSDPGDLARDFAGRYADPLDRYCAERMEELGLPTEQIGSSDHRRGIPWCSF